MSGTVKFLIRIGLYGVAYLGLKIVDAPTDISNWKFWVCWLLIGVACMGFETLGEENAKREIK